MKLFTCHRLSLAAVSLLTVFCMFGTTSIQAEPTRKKQQDTEQTRKSAAPAAENKSHRERKRPGKKERQNSEAKSLTFEQEAELAIVFARKHHPELADLVEQLKAGSPAEYKRAIRELSNTNHRLERMKKRSEKEWDLALRAWKLDSRIRLLAARYKMELNPDLEHELKSLLHKRTDIRLMQLEQERMQLLQRLERVDELARRLQSNQDRLVDTQWNRLLKQLQLDKNRNRKPQKNKTETQTEINSKR